MTLKRPDQEVQRNCLGFDKRVKGVFFFFYVHQMESTLVCFKHKTFQLTFMENRSFTAHTAGLSSIPCVISVCSSVSGGTVALLCDPTL